MGVSMTRHPVVNFSSVVGTSLYKAGAAISFDTLLGRLSQWDAGLSFTTRFVNASVTLTEKADALSASCYSMPLKGTALAAELTHRFRHNQTVFRIGGQQSFTDFAHFKAQAGTDGNIGASVHLDCFSALILTVAGEINVRAIQKSRMGISCSLHYEFPHRVFSSVGIPLSIQFQ